MEKTKKDWKFRVLLLTGLGVSVYSIISILNAIGSFFSPDNVLWFNPGKGALILLIVLMIYVFFAIKYVIRVIKSKKQKKD